MSSLLLFSVVGASLVLLYHLLKRLLSLPHDPKEPPLIPSTIPFIGHVIGLLRNGTRYYSQIANQCNQPIYTLGLPRAKMYIVTSPNLVTACDRKAKVVSFAPYVVDFGRRILAASQPAIDLLSEDLLEEKGSDSLRPETMKAMHQALKPGEGLDEIAGAILKSVASFLDSPANLGNGAGVPLFQWARKFVSVANTDVIYGPKNPLKDPKVMDGFWSVDKHFALLGLMILPDLIVPEGSRGRKRFFDAFERYYAEGGLETASSLIKARYEVNKKHGVPKEDIAHFDLGVCTALLVNTVPAICWTLLYTFSNPALLAELRQGIQDALFQNETPSNCSNVMINVAELVQKFPLLESFVKEVLRIQSNSTSARFLLKDTIVEDGHGASYLLKKDSFLAMPSVPVHNSEAVWGPTAQTFDPARFLKHQQQNYKIPASSSRTFGGGNALCPGRHLAMNEIIGVLAIMVLRFDIEPVGGAWKMPETTQHISTTILTPAKDIWVNIKPREDIGGIKWSLS